MFKRINNWHLSVLVIVVSVLSLVMIQQSVFAVWVDPTTQPGNTPSNNIVLNPLAETLQMGTNNITGTHLTLDGDSANSVNITNSGNLCLNDPGDDSACIDAWSDVSGGGYWTQNPSNPLEIFYNTGYVGIGTNDPADWLHIKNITSGQSLKIAPNHLYSRDGNDALEIYGEDGLKFETADFADVDMYISTGGKIGIGTNLPNSLPAGRVLHIYDDINNAELDIQSVAGNQEHWSLYHDSASDDFRFWHNGVDRVVFTDDGNVGIGTTLPYFKLQVEGTDTEAATIYSVQKNNTGGTAFSGIQTDTSNNLRALGAMGNYGPEYDDFGVLTGKILSAGVLGATDVPGSTTYKSYGVWGSAGDAMSVGVYGDNQGVPGGGGSYTDKSVGVLGEGHYAVVGHSLTSTGRGVFGQGYYGVKAEAVGSGGTAIYGDKGTGSYAGKFMGDVLVSNATLKVEGGYLQMSYKNSGPDGGDICNNLDTGKIFLDDLANVLYICTGLDSGWKAISL